jgi:hypothetical protein
LLNYLVKATIIDDFVAFPMYCPFLPLKEALAKEVLDEGIRSTTS